MGSPMTLMMRPVRFGAINTGAEAEIEAKRTEELSSDGNLNGVAGISHGLTADKTLCTVHGNGAHSVLTEMLGNLEHEAGVTALDLKGVEDVRQFYREE